MNGYGRVAAAAMLWGCWTLFLRPSGFDGPASAFILFAVMSLPIPFALRGANLRDRGAWLALGLLGVFDAGNAWLYFAAVKQGPIAVAVLAHYLTPLLVALFAPWIAGERRSVRALLSTPLSLGGLALLLWSGSGTGRFALNTALLGAGSAMFFAAIFFAGKRAGRTFSALGVTALHAPISAAVVLGVFGRQALPNATPIAWAWGVAGAALCGLFATTLFNGALKRIPSQSASVITYLEPLTAAAVGWGVFGETLSATGMLGGAIVLGCGAWVVSERSAPTVQPA